MVKNGFKTVSKTVKKWGEMVKNCKKVENGEKAPK